MSFIHACRNKYIYEIYGIFDDYVEGLNIIPAILCSTKMLNSKYWKFLRMFETLYVYKVYNNFISGLLCCNILNIFVYLHVDCITQSL